MIAFNIKFSETHTKIGLVGSKRRSDKERKYYGQLHILHIFPSLINDNLKL